jgi:surface antigen
MMTKYELKCVLAKITKPRLLLISTLVSTLILFGCETTSHGQQGEVIGGVIGGVIGSQVGGGSGQTAAIIIGTIAGGMIGRHIGETMDDTDRMMTARTFSDTRTGQSTSWVNPDTGYEYSVTPTRTFEISDGPCREFRLDASVDNEPDQEVQGTACLQPDGSWLVE